MPFKRSTYSNWEVIGVEPIVIQNQDSGKTVTLQDDGTAETESIKVGQANNTHYVKNPESETEINDAIAALPDADSELVIWYPEDATDTTTIISAPVTDQTKTGVTLRQVGDGKLKVADGTPIAAIDIVNVDGWTFENLEIDGNIANQTDQGDKDDQTGILTAGCSDLTIRDCYIHDTQYANIRVRAEGTPYNKVRIYNNICETTGDNSSGGSDNISITAGSNNFCTDFAVVNNRCLDCGHQAIEISVGCLDGRVAFNYVEGSTESSIVLHFGSHQACVGNTVVNQGPQGRAGIDMDVANSACVGNVVRDSDGGILVQQPATCVGNVIENSGPLQLDGVTGSIGPNYIKNAVSKGLRVTNAPGETTINGVVVDGSGDLGIECEQSDVTFNGCVVLDAGTRGLRMTADRIRFLNGYISGSNSTAITVENASGHVHNTTLSNNGDKGINIFSSATDTRLSGIDGVGNTTSLLDLSSGVRTAVNGTVELSAPPTDTNYTPKDAGLVILDTSTTPATEYKVLQDGSTSTVQ